MDNLSGNAIGWSAYKIKKTSDSNNDENDIKNKLISDEDYKKEINKLILDVNKFQEKIKNLYDKRNVSELYSASVTCDEIRRQISKTI